MYSHVVVDRNLRSGAGELGANIKTAGKRRGNKELNFMKVLLVREERS